jgi:hypothetical protein
MTLADLPVLNPSSPGREAKRAFVVGSLFAVFGALYALARAAASAPRDVSASTDPLFGFAFPRGWGISQAAWSGASTWPTRIASSDMGTTLAVLAVVIMAIALVVIMHPDILSRQGPQYVSPARRITTVAIAFVLAFIVYAGTSRIDDLLTSTISSDPDRARRNLVGFAAISVILFGGVWSFIGPKDFGRRIPLRISHGALGGLAVWAAITFATMLSSGPRSFLSGSLDTYYSLLTVDAANGTPGATAGWAMSSDILTAAVAMAVAGALLTVTAPQSLGPGNRRGGALVGAVFGLFLAVVSLTTYSVTQKRAATVAYSVTEQLQMDKTGVSRASILLAGAATPMNQRVYRAPVVPTNTADDCMHSSGDDRQLPAATISNVQRLTAWLDAHGNEVSGASIRVHSCRAALQTLRWDIEAARAGVFMSQHPERTGAFTYLLAAPSISAAKPAMLRQILAAMSDTARYQHGSQAAQQFADLARVAGDTALEAAWRQRIIQPTAGSLSTMIARPSYVDGQVTGHLRSSKAGWRIGLLVAPDPSMGSDPTLSSPRGEGPILSSMVAAMDVGAAGRFTFSGLRDGYYMLALLAPEGSSASAMSGLRVTGDPGVFRLEPARKVKDVGQIGVEY